MSTPMDHMKSILNQTAPYLDPHLFLSCLEFLEQRKCNFSDAKKTILRSTYMFQKAQEVFGDEFASTGLAKKKNQVLERMEALEKDIEPIVVSFFSTGKNGEMECSVKGRILLESVERSGVTSAQIRSAFELAGLYHASARYGVGAELLRFLLSVDKCDAVSGKKRRTAQWGLLCCAILSKKWALAATTIDTMEEEIREGNPTATEALWMMHWWLFVAFEGRRSWRFIDVVMLKGSNDPLNLIESRAPYMYRYLVAACFLNREKDVRRRLVDVLLRSSYRDPLVELAIALWHHRDFDDIQTMIPAVTAAMDEDCFLHMVRNDIVEAVQKMVVEDFVRTHKKVSLTFMSERLGRSLADTERWMANLIRETKLPARIDSVAMEILAITSSREKYDRLVRSTLQQARRQGLFTRSVEDPLLNERRPADRAGTHAGRA